MIINRATCEAKQRYLESVIRNSEPGTLAHDSAVEELTEITLLLEDAQ